ncbi:hypothetical protein BG004_000222, partial [Podila humilis]
MDDDEDEQQYMESMSTRHNNHNSTNATSSSGITFSLENLPKEFVEFLARTEIDPAIYTVADLPRYVRLNPDPHLTITPQQLALELGTHVDPVPGLEAFCRLDGST